MGVNKRRLAQVAARWWVRLGSKGLSRSKREELADWLRESPLHVDEMLRMAHVHRTLEGFTGWDRIATQEPDGTAAGSAAGVPFGARAAAAPRTGSGEPRHRAGFRFAFATAAATALAVWAVWVLWPGGYTVETVQGERRAITLAEGSVIKVDPQTRLRIRFDSRLRQIDLREGRARFRVAKDPTRAFVVQADGTVVRALGTEFGVEHRDQGIVVTVAAGTVTVLPPSHSPLSPPTPGTSASDENRVRVSTGQQVTVTPSGAVGAVREVDADKELSWAEGRLTFENERIAAVVAAFNRYNTVHMRVVDSALAERKMSGVFDASDPQSFLAFLESVTSVSVARDGREITIGATP